MTMIHRDKSPISNISRTLLFEKIVGAQVTAGSRKRSNRRSLEDDLKRDFEENKENIDAVLASASRRLSRKLSRPSFDDKEKLCVKVSSQERGRSLTGKSIPIVPEVFRYPSPRPSPKSSRVPLPAISVHHDDDDVFETQDTCHLAPPSSKLLLSPSTARTPRIQISSTSSQYLSTLLPSPNIDRGVCCSTKQNQIGERGPELNGEDGSWKGSVWDRSPWQLEREESGYQGDGEGEWRKDREEEEVFGERVTSQESGA